VSYGSSVPETRHKRLTHSTALWQLHLLTAAHTVFVFVAVLAQQTAATAPALRALRM